MDLPVTACNRYSDKGLSPDLLLQCSSEQLQQQIFFTLVCSVVVQRQYCWLHELGHAAQRHRKHQSGQVDGVRLQQVEQVLIGLQTVTVRFTQRLEAVRWWSSNLHAAVCLEFLVLRHNVLPTTHTTSSHTHTLCTSLYVHTHCVHHYMYIHNVLPTTYN